MLLAHIGERGKHNIHTLKKYPSPKSQFPLNTLQLALAPTIGIYSSVTGKMLRALHEDSRDPLRIFLASFLILLDPMDITTSDRALIFFMLLSCFISKSVVFDFSLLKKNNLQTIS